MEKYFLETYKILKKFAYVLNNKIYLTSPLYIPFSLYISSCYILYTSRIKFLEMMFFLFFPLLIITEISITSTKYVHVFPMVDDYNYKKRRFCECIYHGKDKNYKKLTRSKASHC